METRTQLPEIRRRRGISAAQLARAAGVSRQTIYAMEAGDYVPNTTLALGLARILEVHVEDLFQLEGESQAPAKPVAAEVLHVGEPLRKGQPVQLCEVGKRLIAVPAEPQPAVLPLADGVLIEQVRHAGTASVRAFPADGSEGKRLLVAGCDPGIALLAHHLSRTAGVELVVASSSSRQSLNWLKDGFVHIAGSHLRDASTGDYNLAAVRKLFPRGGVKVVTFAIWEQGLVFASGNPKGIRSAADLARHNGKNNDATKTNEAGRMACASSIEKPARAAANSSIMNCSVPASPRKTFWAMNALPTDIFPPHSPSVWEKRIAASRPDRPRRRSGWDFCRSPPNGTIW